MFFEYSDESQEWYTIVVIGIALPAALRALSSFFEKLVWQNCTHYLCGADPFFLPVSIAILYYICNLALTASLYLKPTVDSFP